jgi:hypothetical protein
MTDTKFQISTYWLLVGHTLPKTMAHMEQWQERQWRHLIVTGGVALISQMWPYMKGENLVKLLTTTACKAACVTDYNVNIHGSGLMDLEAATRPVGAVGIPTTGRTTSSVSTVSLSGTGGSGSSLAALSNVRSIKQRL